MGVWGSVSVGASLHHPKFINLENMFIFHHPKFINLENMFITAVISKRFKTK
jgi:hypothetical protein